MQFLVMIRQTEAYHLHIKTKACNEYRYSSSGHWLPEKFSYVFMSLNGIVKNNAYLISFHEIDELSSLDFDALTGSVEERGNEMEEVALS